jgi:glycosyltransferase involved in cell wall biosynthesis
MRTLIVTHYFPPEIGAPQARLSELAAHWAEEGDDVTVLTGMPNHLTGIIPPEYRGRVRTSEHQDGYRIVRTWLYATPNEGMVNKTLGHLSFMLSGLLLGVRATGGADAVVVSSPTFFSIFTVWALAKLKRARLVVEVRDLRPGIFIELGVLTNRWLIHVLETLELSAYLAADKVVVVSEGFRDNLVQRGVPDEKVVVIRNGVDLNRFGAANDDHESVRERLGAAPDQTLVLYVGAHGISHGLSSIADAAAEPRHAPVRFAFVGEGAAKPDLQRRVEELGLNGQVTLHPGVPREEVPGLLAAADICLVPLRDVPLFSTFIPPKIFEYFAAEKCVVGAVRGEPAQILKEGGAVVVQPEDPTALAEAVAELANDPQRRNQMGAHGRAYVEEHFDRRTLARRYQDVLSGAPPQGGAA